MACFLSYKTKTVPNSFCLFGVETEGAMAAIGAAAIPPFEVVFFCENFVSLRGQIKVLFFEG
jgi:hypothetical protein